MSGGSMNYLSFKIEEYADMLEDMELIDLAKDIAEIYHEAEWYHSGDTSRGTYQSAVNKFKDKWFKKDRTDRLKEYIESQIDKCKDDMLRLVGLYNRCEHCVHSSPCGLADYVDCDCRLHKEDCCGMFESKP